MSDSPVIRRPVAVLLSRFPLITETFILREITELEKQGQPVLLVPMIREHQEIVHEEAKPWMSRALFTPWLSAAILLANLRALIRKPGVMLRLLAWITGGTLLHPGTMARSLLLFPKAVYLAERLSSEGIALTHAHFATHPVTIARIIQALSGIPYSFTVHAHDIFVDRTLLREKIRDAAFIRAISTFNKRFLETLFPAEAGSKISVVHVGIETEKYESRSPRVSHDPLRLVCIAALKPYKGITYLVEACRLLAHEGLSFRCDIIGSGPLRGPIRRAIVKAGLQDRIRLRGALPQHIVAEELRDSDVFVLPSIIATDGQMEGIPVALMEAMAAGVPVISTSISGIPELVVNGESGLLVDPGNSRNLAEAIAKLIQHPELRERYAARGRQAVADSFDLRACTAGVLRLLDAHNAMPDEDAVDLIGRIAQPGESYGLRHVHRGPDAIVCEVSCVDGLGVRDLVVKRHRAREGESRPPLARASDEWTLLHRLAVHFESREQMSAPLPVRFLESDAIVVMTRAAGASLTDVIRSTRDEIGSDPAPLRRAMRGTGAWLHAFQDLESADAAPVIEHIAARAIADAERTGASRRIRSQVLALAEELRRRPMRAVAYHGDFWPGNVFTDGNTVEVIDFEGYGLSLPAHDIAYFFLHASLYFRARGEHWMDVVRESFFDGYAGALDPAALALCRIATALQMAARRPSSNLAQRMIYSHVLRKELSR